MFGAEQAIVDFTEAGFDPDADAGEEDLFSHNLVRFRAETRAEAAVTRPAGFVSVSLAEGS